MHTPQRWMIGSLLVLGSGSVAWSALAGAPAAKPDPVAEQVKAGAAVFARNCQGCHGDKLQGVRAPALVGEGFTAEYTGAEHTFADLHTKVSKAMPMNAPGSLSDEQYLAVVAFVFSKNGVTLPEGGLSADTLKFAALNARAAQVKAGAAVYAKSCQGCHGDKLQGVRGPTLLGADFLAHRATVGDLHEKVAKTMPRNAPASLTDAQYLAVVAFLLDQNKVAGGTAALSDKDFKTPLK